VNPVAQALEGIKVIDISQVAAVPMCARHLADFGADVIHIERPVIGDSWRFYQANQVAAMNAAPSAINYNWEVYNRNKRSIALDLKKESGRKILHRLIEGADVLLTNLRSFEIKRFRLEYAELSRINPRIVYGSLNAFGTSGPDKNLPGYDVLAYWYRSGIADVFSYPGVPVLGFRPGFGDNGAAMALAYGVMVALFVREKTGLGQEVHVSLLHAGMYQISYDIAGALVTGLDFADWRESPPPEAVAQAEMAIERIGRFYKQKRTNPLEYVYRTRDSRRICITSLQPDRYWRKFCSAIGRDDLANESACQTIEGRAERCAALIDTIQETFATKTLAEWLPLLEHNIPFAVVQTAKEAANDPQARASGCFVSYDHPKHSRIESIASHICLSKTPAEVRMPAPDKGQHTEEILLEAGYSKEDIARLKEQKVIA
jgi:crotonobetainyl-CoA:carnitine CoA-transferase CaiB-like acyl-CoA transferase